MRRAAVAVTVALLLGGTGPESRGQSGVSDGSTGGRGSRGPYGRMFDPATVQTVRGEVASVELINSREDMACGVCLRLRMKEGPLSIHLGPESYVNHQRIRIEVGDAVEVTGSRVLFEGEPVIIAARVRKGNGVLRLRDARGVPAWSGWCRRGASP
jgi:hypothetical protein